MAASRAGDARLRRRTARERSWRSFANRGSHPLLGAIALASLLTSVASAEDARQCAEWKAVIVSAVGNVEVRSGVAAAWQPARQDATLCSGDTVRVNDFGRAALRFRDGTLVRLDRNSTLALLESDDESGSLLELVRGIIYVISRDPRALKFTTPYANAGLEGTEFSITVDERQTEISVIEGEVLVANAAGELAAAAGQRVVAAQGSAPRATRLADPFEATRWTPYYAPILYLDLPPPDAVADARQSTDPEFFAARAARRLAVGAAAAAEADLERALALAPENATALALAALAALGRGDKVSAAAAANAAVDADPSSVSARIALAHVQQAKLDFRSALGSLERATTLEPDNAIAWAWLAELRLGRGDARGALAAAERAAALAPDLAHVQTVLGFVYLEHSTSERAMSAFRSAVRLDQEDPLPRIGLALALLRDDRLEEGREQAEIAVILGPGNSQIRSYMAKIYAEENRLELTASQLEIAKTLDVADPTPHLYAALSKQTDNQPVEAWQSLNSATALNGNRPVSRSTLHMDGDFAVRSFGIGQLQDLGFEKLALLDAWKSTAQEPREYSGHRMLADLYSVLPRHESARVNELYKAMVLQPLNFTPVPAQLAEANLFMLSDMGPSDLGFSEYGPLVRRDGLALLASGVTATNATEGASVSVTGLGDRISYGGGHFAFETDGFRENNDIDQRVTNALVDFRPNYETSFHAELRSSDLERGDTRLLFDASVYNPLLRQNEQVDSLNLAMRRSLAQNGTFVASIIFEDVSLQASSGDIFSWRTSRSGPSLEVQQILEREGWSATVGLHHARKDQQDLTTLTPPVGPQVITESAADTTYTTAYAYSTLRLTQRVTATAGLSADFLDGQSGNLESTNPKLGLMFEPTAKTTVRASYAETLEGPLVSKFNIQPRLEPTHVMGFNQFFYGSEGERAARLGLALDHELARNLFSGAELSQREVELEAISVLPDFSTLVENLKRDELLASAYLYWAPTPQMSVAVEYQYEDIDANGEPLVDGYESLKTQRLPLSVSLFTERNLQARVKVTLVAQKGNFSPVQVFPGPVIEPGSDSFGVVDLSLSYRLPKRHGSLSAYLYNALDESFNFQDTDPEKQSIMPERMLSFRFTISY
jgi:tetratricopeptide (TPR) repeat protein